MQFAVEEVDLLTSAPTVQTRVPVRVQLTDIRRDRAMSLGEELIPEGTFRCGVWE